MRLSHFTLAFAAVLAAHLTLEPVDAAKARSPAVEEKPDHHWTEHEIAALCGPDLPCEAGVDPRVYTPCNQQRCNKPGSPFRSVNECGRRRPDVNQVSDGRAIISELRLDGGKANESGQGKGNDDTPSVSERGDGMVGLGREDKLGTGSISRPSAHEEL